MNTTLDCRWFSLSHRGRGPYGGRGFCMGKLISPFAWLLPGLPCAGLLCSGQPVFTVQDVPSRIGLYARAYVDTHETAAASLIGGKGAGQRWDFSQPKSATEEIRRIDIVAPGDGGHGADFPTASYAERTTREGNGARSWSYYSIVPVLGRSYAGFYDEAANPTDPLTVFDDPTIDLPANIALNQTWRREVNFQDVLDAGFGEITVAIHFIAEAAVDASGTLVLPQIGEVQALRVNELHTYETQDTTLGLPLGSQFVRNYYWLVKGIGKAVEIISKTDASSAPPDNFEAAATVLRVFESSGFQLPPFRSVTNLVASVKGKDVFLKWTRVDSVSSYSIEAADSVRPNAVWAPLSTSPDNFFFDPVDPTVSAKFYRILYRD